MSLKLGEIVYAAFERLFAVGPTSRDVVGVAFDERFDDPTIAEHFA